MNQPTAPVHNRFKLRFFVLCLLIGLVMVVGGAVTGYLGLVIPGGFVVAVSLAPIWVIVTGRGNPWWMRSPLDPQPSDGPGPAGDGISARLAAAGRGQRPKFVFVLVGSAGFVLVSAALIVVGAVRSRPDLIFLGGLGCVVFGATAWVAVTVLRAS